VISRTVAVSATATAITVLLTLSLAGCGGTTTQARPKAKVVSPPTSVTPGATIASADPMASGPPAGSVWIATASVPSLPIYQTPRAPGPAQSLSNPNMLGAPLTLLVSAVQGGWLQVYLPERPNEFTGWVTRTNVTLTTDDLRIVVSLSARKVTLYRGGSQVLQASAAVGSPDSPTPTGHFFVTEDLQLTDPTGPYGPYALGLSGFSNTYYSFDGGPGQIAIHGTNQPQVIGGYASHGCVRLTNPEIAALVQQVPAGTPVDIVA